MTANTYLGFDFGKKHIGVAVGGTASRLAQAIATVTARNELPDWDHISRLIEEWRPGALVVGLPLNMDDSENDMTRAAKKFGNRLRARYNLPVHMVDERLTSVAAKNVLKEAGVPARRHKSRLDRLAAQTILQAFLDEQAGTGHASDH
ncbi:MAG: Holliday junction resolvase RuvX [Pseudomonadota bacterium]|nr:Holliday junction resolvase RuvX [Pseudomonadota bacterium]